MRRFQRHRHSIELEIQRLLSEGLGKEPGNFRLVRPARGATTLTFFVDLGDRRRYVLRCLPRRQEADDLQKTSAFCQEQDIPVPRLVTKSDGLWSRLRTGFHLTLEEFVVGTPVEELLSASQKRGIAVASLANSIAALHNITREDHGPVSSPRSGKYLSYYVKKARQKLTRLHKMIPAIRDEELRSVEQFILRSLNRTTSSISFSLIHGALGGGNVLVHEHGNVIFIDLEHMHFGMPQYDLQSVRHYLLKDDEEAFAIFQKQYYATRKIPPDSDSTQLELFFRVFVLLKSLSPNPADPPSDTWQRQWREILQLTSSDQKSTPPEVIQPSALQAGPAAS